MYCSYPRTFDRRTQQATRLIVLEEVESLISVHPQRRCKSRNDGEHVFLSFVLQRGQGFSDESNKVDVGLGHCVSGGVQAESLDEGFHKIESPRPLLGKQTIP